MGARRYEICLLVFNSTSYSCAALTRELSSETLEEKFHFVNFETLSSYTL